MMPAFGPEVRHPREGGEVIKSEVRMMNAEVGNQALRLTSILEVRHPREGGDPVHSFLVRTEEFRLF